MAPFDGLKPGPSPIFGKSLARGRDTSWPMATQMQLIQRTLQVIQNLAKTKKPVHWPNSNIVCTGQTSTDHYGKPLLDALCAQPPVFTTAKFNEANDHGKLAIITAKLKTEQGTKIWPWVRNVLDDQDRTATSQGQWILDPAHFISQYLNDIDSCRTMQAWLQALLLTCNGPSDEAQLRPILNACTGALENSDKYADVWGTYVPPAQIPQNPPQDLREAARLAAVRTAMEPTARMQEFLAVSHLCVDLLRVHNELGRPAECKDRLDRITRRLVATAVTHVAPNLCDEVPAWEDSFTPSTNLYPAQEDSPDPNN